MRIFETQPSGTRQADGTYSGQAKLLTHADGEHDRRLVDSGSELRDRQHGLCHAEGGTPYPSDQNSTTFPNNPNSLMLTAIGDCALLGQAQGSNNVTSIVINEASTVAAVWALRNFISLDGTTVNITSDATNYTGTSGVGVPENYAGLAHAFLNANGISPYKQGAFVQYTGGGGGGRHGRRTGARAGAELAGLGAVSVHYRSATPGQFDLCTQLYQLATPPGGTAPSNSLAAMLNIAKYPANNAAGILAFSLTAGSGLSLFCVRFDPPSGSRSALAAFMFQRSRPSARSPATGALPSITCPAMAPARRRKARLIPST